ncbi:four helix bundle protein [Candidatus Curtissbacteria bacterium]|nr:four helix bundle protein [Candidatus Curtissbacteria bacterium]
MTIKIYMMTKKLPKEELFGLVSQIRRAAVSVESNLAEGESRYSNADKIKFFIESRSSGAEVETQLLIIRDLYKELFDNSTSLRDEYKVLGKQINSLINFRRRT